MGHCWRIKNKIMNSFLQLTSSHGCVSVGRLRRTYIQQFSMDTGCRLEDLPGVMDDRDDWQEGVWKICASSTSQ